MPTRRDRDVDTAARRVVHTLCTQPIDGDPQDL
jgi:hypothetical protein